ncbi:MULTISPECIES: hypothetical protein [unclassified Rickettsia]|nr:MULTISPECIES: hypothetical protein [unclassified Rickettsia]
MFFIFSVLDKIYSITLLLLMSPFGDQKSLAFMRREDIMKLL